MEFVNVKLIAKANIYDGGKVASRTFYTPDGQRKTLGFMQAGEYEFATAAAELMEVLQGEMLVLLPGEGEFSAYAAGTSFNVPAASSFKVKVSEYADYCCSYLE
jgi:uncharacterized protein YaiE (UPF0345 family)